MAVVAPSGEEQAARAMRRSFLRRARDICSSHVEAAAKAVPVARAGCHVEVSFKSCFGDDPALLGVGRIRFIAPDHRCHIFGELRHQIGPFQNDVGPEMRLMVVFLRQRKQAI